jgi:nucleoside-diphosphate-sugar epimerase
LVLGATGKTGRRVAQRLTALGYPVRGGSRSGRPRFDWQDRLSYLFREVLDGRNARVGDGVRRALGREPRDFTGYARRAAASGVWDIPAAIGADR